MRGDTRQMSLRLLQARVPAGFFAIRPLPYILIVLGAVLAAYVYTLRHDGIFACQASDYAPDRYIAECSAAAYGNYEHGAFWFGLEPAAVEAATQAEALFLGDSRLQVGLNTAATADWFSKAGAHYYLLGFGGEKIFFVAPLLRKLKPKAKVYIINIDTFFGKIESASAKFVMEDPAAKTRYSIKRLWQQLHRPICSAAPALCGNRYVVFRSRTTGGYFVRGKHDQFGRWYQSAPVSYVRTADKTVAAAYIAAGKEFLSNLPVDRQCIVATVIPHVRTNMVRAKAVANGLGLNLVAPRLDGLQTFDASHLDPTSSQRWSTAFYAAAGPQIRKCLDAQ